MFSSGLCVQLWNQAMNKVNGITSIITLISIKQCSNISNVCMTWADDMTTWVLPIFFPTTWDKQLANVYIRHSQSVSVFGMISCQYLYYRQTPLAKSMFFCAYYNWLFLIPLLLAPIHQAEHYSNIIAFKNVIPHISDNKHVISQNRNHQITSWLHHNSIRRRAGIW